LKKVIPTEKADDFPPASQTLLAKPHNREKSSAVPRKKGRTFDHEYHRRVNCRGHLQKSQDFNGSI
jgi:hypothetical protein